MLTIFSTPKDFIGHFDIIQTNAINSWRALSNDIEIIIFGNSIGAKEVAATINAIHIENVPVSDNGLPTIPGLFESAESNGSNNIYCFLNSDIILPPDFLPAIQNIYSQMTKFLAVGYRFNIDVESIIDFSSQYESNLFFKNAQQKSIRESSSAIDIFCFTKGIYKKIPEFTVGRPGFDNWLIWKARRTFIPVIDITSDTKVFHQNHSYNFKGLKNHSDVLKSEEAKMNYKLMGEKGLTLNDANWILDNSIVTKKRDDGFKQRNLGKIPIIFPEISLLLIWYKRIYRHLKHMFNN